MEDPLETSAEPAHAWRAKRMRLVAWLRLRRCALVLGGLVLFVLAQPLTGSGSTGRLLVNLMLLLILLFALWALDPERHVGFAGWAAAAAIVALHAGFLAGSAAAGRAVTFGYALLELSVTLSLLRYVLNAQRVTVDKILGAIAAYLLLAMLFASLFSLLLLFEPEAFRSSVDDDGRLGWFDLFYFAMTVLTSTGFGEIVAANDRARSLIILAQLSGTMYAAFLVARLANLFPTRR